MNYIYLIVCILFGFNVFGHSCLHKDLSEKYNFETKISKEFNKPNKIRIIVKVIRKLDNKIVSNIFFDAKAELLLDTEFKSCNNVRSYVTGKNKNLNVIDNDFGDIIICDFNFDGKEDIAIKSDSGGNGGPMYKYYIQNNKEDFIVDSFLSETMSYFPINVDKKKKRLTTLVHANAYQQYKTVYSIDSKGVWKQMQAKLLP